MAEATDQPRVRALGYLGLTGPIDEWRTFATDLLGLQQAPESTDDRLVLRADERAWRIQVQPGDGGMAFAGFELTDARELRQMGDRLDAAGISVQDVDGSERGVAGLLRVKDPGGNTIELFHGAAVAKERFVSPRGVKFVMGDMGLGHIFLSVPDMDEAVRFYIDLLGVRITDRITFGPNTALFTHCNPRHHTLAMMQTATPGLGHFMLQVEDLDSVGYALDLVNAGAAPLQSTLGKHTNDHMISIYVMTPSGFAMEYGWNGRRVDDATWIGDTYDAASFWGHKRMPKAPVVEG